jgi:ribonuclease Y
MSQETIYAVLAIAVLLSVIIGYFLRILVALGRNNTLELRVRREILAARSKAQELVADAQEDINQLQEKHDRRVLEYENKFEEREQRIAKQEVVVAETLHNYREKTTLLEQGQEEIQKTKQDLQDNMRRLDSDLERVAELDKDEARQLLYENIAKQESETLTVRLQKIDRFARSEIEDRARLIMLQAMERLSQSVVTEHTTTTVELKDDEEKGKIIGKEGRNIKAFERATGVEVLIDETPGVVTLSTFDPVRREIARRALSSLIKDGRIQPAKIEDEVDRSQREVKNIIKKSGENAAAEIDIYDLDPRLVTLLGQLRFRTSYGQNVLDHSIQTAQFAGLIAEEIGVNVAVAKKAALLHDIGKSIDHQLPGSHVDIGIRLLKKFGVEEEVITAMKSHHNDFPHESAEAFVVQASDALSASRPGARRENIEYYLKRLEDLEIIATSFGAVEKAYAIEAGREIRVFVKSEDTSDSEARNIARNIALRIEKEIRFPGEIKINVIRETRSIEYAR